MSRKWFFVLALCSAHAAVAQDPGVSVTVGARAWYTDWTTFSYVTDDAGENIGLTQNSANAQLAVIPILSVRYGKFMGSFSGIPSTNFSFNDGTKGAREEFDINVGYFVMRGVALTVGYKKVQQSNGSLRYRPSGPVIGVNASAPLHDAWSLYGNLSLGLLDTPASDAIDFDMAYRLTEVGLAYTLDGKSRPKHWTFTAGYRIQVMNSKDAIITATDTAQDGLDTTQGFSLGVLATF
jgi:hypothetical protein